MTDLLFCGDTERSQTMRHKLPLLIGHHVGEVRFEDLLPVTDDGCETLTRHPYELTPQPAANAAGPRGGCSARRGTAGGCPDRPNPPRRR